MSIVLMLVLWLPLTCNADCIYEHDIILEIHEEIPVFFGAESEEFELFLKLLYKGAIQYDHAKQFNFPYLTSEQIIELHTLADEYDICDDDEEEAPDYDLSE